KWGTGRIPGGSISASRRSSHGAHASISSGCGSRLPGGRHFTTFAMYTSSRVKPIPSMSWVSSWPARPTNGSPFRSSCSPGPSPTNMRLASARPTPNTTCVRPPASLQSAHVDDAAATSASDVPASVAGCDDCDDAASESKVTEPPFEDAAMLPTGASDRIGHQVGGRDPQPVEMDVDDAGRQGDREVAVEAGVRRPQRTSDAVVGALRDQMT